MRLAVLQLSYGDDEPIDARRERVAAMVRDQRGADLVVLPELWAAGDIEAVVHAGSVIERAPAGPDGRGLWNTSVLLGPDGSVLATYRKVHRFGFGQGEPSLLEAGTEVVTVPLPGTDVVAGR